VERHDSSAVLPVDCAEHFEGGFGNHVKPP